MRRLEVTHAGVGAPPTPAAVVLHSTIPGATSLASIMRCDLHAGGLAAACASDVLHQPAVAVVTGTKCESLMRSLRAAPPPASASRARNRQPTDLGPRRRPKKYTSLYSVRPE
jgi:hypothetical protein